MPRLTICLADRTHRALTEAVAPAESFHGFNTNLVANAVWREPVESGDALTMRGTPTCGRCSSPIRRHNWSPVTGCLSRTLRAAPL